MSGLLELFREVGSRGAATRTILQLAKDFEIATEGGLLSAIAAVRKQIEENGLEVVPPFEAGDLETERVVTFARERELTEAAILADVDADESPTREFKGSLQYDLRRAENDPGQPPNTYRSPAVLHAALKTIAAFANCDGGALYVGVANDRTILGLDKDYQLASTPNRDRIELHLRDCIRTKFYEGDMVGAFVSVKIVVVTGMDIAKIEVTPRPQRISCLANEKGDGYTVYRRDGNRSLEVPIECIEEFIRSRRRTN